MVGMSCIDMCCGGVVQPRSPGRRPAFPGIIDLSSCTYLSVPLQLALLEGSSFYCWAEG